MEGSERGRWPYAVKIVLLAAAYYGAAKLGLGLAFAAPSVTAIWAPTGIALAAIILWGYRVWPGVALGALLANAWTGIPFYSVLGITIGNTLEGLAGAYLLCQVAGVRPSLERVRDVLALAVLAAGVSTTISATIGVASLLVGNEISSSELASVWRTWWLGDMGGDLVVAPAILVAATHWPFRKAPGRLPEAVALAAVVLGVSVLAFSQSTPLTFLVTPPLVWACLRFWQLGAVGTVLLIAGISIPLTESDTGPFAGFPPDERLLLAQGFLGVASLTGLVLAAVITERARAEETAEHIARTLQESLVPSHLPTIPGFEIAADFRPAGEHYLVGGDFYDLFAQQDGTWTVVVGDVLGKGATAAAATGLARYTLRAAAVHETQPSRILKLLNDAIRRQSPDQLCTVACGRLEPKPINGARLTLSVGGHPLPLVLRRDGGVEPVGKHGTILGVFSDPELTDETDDLEPGDSLVLYTDGLTDAYAPERIVKRAGLVAALEACAGGSASEIAQQLESAVLGPTTAEPRDDIVLLVLRIPERPATAAVP
jgi:integral membrane sensor domain MASE1